MISAADIDVTFEGQEWAAAFEKWAERARKPIAELLGQEMALAIKQLVLGTPPFRSPFDKTFSGQIKIGKGAVDRDVRRVYAPIDSGRVYATIAQKDRDAARGYWAAVKQGNRKEAKRILRSITGLEVERYANPDLHQAARDNRGRVRQGTRVKQVLGKGEISRYSRTVQARVGTAKAGWLAGAERLKVKGIPAAIRRQNRRGRLTDRRQRTKDPDITTHNHVEYIRRLIARLGITERAVLQRIQSLERRAATVAAKEVRF